jgi:hypothetical protein
LEELTFIVWIVESRHLATRYFSQRNLWKKNYRMEESCRWIAVRTQKKFQSSPHFTVAVCLTALQLRGGCSALSPSVFLFVFQVTCVFKVPGTSIAAVVFFFCEIIRRRLKGGPLGKSWGGRRTLGDSAVCVRPFFTSSDIRRRTCVFWHLPRITRQPYSGVKFVTHLFDNWPTYRSARVLKKVYAMTILKPAGNPGRGERDDSNNRIKESATEKIQRAQAHCLGGAAVGPLAQSLSSPWRAASGREPRTRRIAAGFGLSSITRLRA